MKKVVSWLVSLFSKKPASPVLDDGYAFDCFTTGERDIYKYFNGEQVVKVDPMIIHKKIMDVGPELSVDMKVARSPMKDARVAHDKMIQKIRNIFSLSPYVVDGDKEHGLTERECVNLLDHFLLFEDIQKKITEPSPTPVPETPSSSASPSAENLPSEKLTDFGSTVSELSTSEPPKLPTVPVSPLEGSTQAGIIGNP